MEIDIRVLPAFPNARSPMSGYVLIVGSESMHLWINNPVKKVELAITRRRIKVNHPPDANAYGIESIPTPENPSTHKEVKYL